MKPLDKQIYNIYKIKKDGDSYIINQDIVLKRNKSNLFKKYNIVEINGNLKAQGCGLTNLDNFPKIINGSLNISWNNLESLENFPQVNDRIWLDGNHIKSLKGICKKIKDGLSIFSTKLNTIRYAPYIENFKYLGVSDDTNIPLYEIEIYRKCLEKGIWNPDDDIMTNAKRLKDTKLINECYKAVAQTYGF